jgi:hypothetical protein
MPPVVGTFRPVVAAVPARTAGPRRGVRIVGAPRKPVGTVPDPARRPPGGDADVPVERTEQVG